MTDDYFYCSFFIYLYGAGLEQRQTWRGELGGIALASQLESTVQVNFDCEGYSC